MTVPSTGCRLPLFPRLLAATICDLIPDAVDPSMVVASVSWARPEDLMGEPPQMAFPEFLEFITFDGGAHWQPLPGSEPVLLQWLATYHGTTLAIVESSSGDVSLAMITQSAAELARASSGSSWAGVDQSSDRRSARARRE